MTGDSCLLMVFIKRIILPDGPETRLTNQKTQLYKKCENHSNLICIEKSFKIFNQVKHSCHAQL